MEYKDDQIKYLEFLQNIITRMGNNSFLVKGWAITIVSALLGFFANNKISFKELSNIIILLVPIVGFLVLDSYYLRLERIFRKKYETVVEEINKGTFNGTNIFKISGKNTKNEKTNFMNVICSGTILLTYGPIVAILGILFIIG